MKTLNKTKSSRRGATTRTTIISIAVLSFVHGTGGLPAQSIDRSQETNAIWSPPATKDTEQEYAKRVGYGRTPFAPVQPKEVSKAPNPVQSSSDINTANRVTTPRDLDIWRKDGQSGTPYNTLLVDPRDGAADRTGRSHVEQALSGKNLNTDPRSLTYLRNAARAMTTGSSSRGWQWAFGSEKFIRIAATGNLVASVNSGNANHTADVKIVGTFFRKTREIGNASLNSVAPSSPTSVKTANLVVNVLGRRMVSEIISDMKPFVKNLKTFELAPEKTWWAGSFKVPWLAGLGIALKLDSSPVTVTPRVAVGNSSAAGEVSLRSGIEVLGEVPLASLFGFAKIVARVNFKPLDGMVVGGNSVGLAWSASGQPMIRDARYARTDIQYGAVGAKVKAVVGFSAFGFDLFDKDYTLFWLFRHDGSRSSREIISHVNEVPLR